MALKTRAQERHLERMKQWQFQKGDSPNPGGVSAVSMNTARMVALDALKSRQIMADALARTLERVVNEADTDEEADAAVLRTMSNQNIRFLKETEDRGMGTAVQSVLFDGKHEVGPPTAITRRIVDPAASDDGAGDTDTSVGDTSTPS